ncbi:MAG: S9 family peptidase, partial [Bradyrhizobium sp.]|nr:S9 family peptidase [Bradyrhizobium sp.]
MMDQTSPLTPPIAQRRPHSFTTHGITIADDYAWLKDENWQEVLRDPSVLKADIRNYLEAENAYTESVLGRTAALQKRLVKEMRARIKEDDSSVPSPDGLYAYLSKFREGGQHQLFGRTPREGGEADIILDGDQLAAEHEYFKFGGSRHSPDHRFQAWSADTKGSEYFSIRVREWATRKDLDDVVDETDGAVVWSSDASAFFYVKLDDNHRPLQVWRHRLGTRQSDDVLVYEEADAGWFTHIHESSTGRYCVIAGGDHETSEQRLIDLADPNATPRLVAAREEGVQYSVNDRGDQLFILTNADGAIDFKIVTAPLHAPERTNWRDLVPYREGIFVLDVELYSGHMVRLERANALPAIVIRDLEGGEEHAIAFDEAAYSLDTMGGYEFETTNLRFSYSSMTTPSEVYDYDMAKRTRILRKRQEIPSGHNPADYVTTRIMAKSYDGAEVPVSILHRRDLKRDGTAPLLLYGYGSYGMAMPASFSANRLSLVDRGFVYAIAHIRGGADKGWGWYLDGKRAKKTNSFDDFIACARALIAERYTSAKRIVAHGGSAGGMLMGAVANRAGELFAGIIAEVPFVDVLNTMLDLSLPLTPPEWPEWGNPAESEADFKTILSYSPYDNVAAKEYPAILAMGGLTDPRVTYWEPA